MPDPVRILVPLAPGFEEIEAITIIDVLRRAELDVTVAGLSSALVVGAHGIGVATDAVLGALDLARFEVLVLPGGQPGTRNLMADERILALVRKLDREQRLTAAICAAPLVLHAAGILDGVAVTAFPAVQKDLIGADVRTSPAVVHSGHVITSQGAGTAMEFALALVSELCGAARARDLGRSMVVPERSGADFGPRTH